MLRRRFEDDGRRLCHGFRLGSGCCCFEALCLGRKLVVLRGQQIVQVAHRLEEYVQPGLALDGPEDAAMLEPGVGKDPMQSSKDIDEVLDAGVFAVSVVEDGEPAGEQLLVRDNVGCPVQRVAAVVDGAAALGLLVNGAQELPLGRAHLGTGRGAARGRVEQEAHDEGVASGDEESAELVEPDGAIDGGGGCGKLHCGVARYRLGSGSCVVVVESGEMLLELKC